jgi:hypothetical protein
MRRWYTTATMVCLVVAGAAMPASGTAEVGPIEDTGPDLIELDVGDDTSDVQGDLSDSALEDVSEDAADIGSDTPVDAAVDARVDAQMDATDATETVFRYGGTIDLADRSDDSGTTVSLTQIDGAATGMATTGTDGGFEIMGLPAGQYRAEFTADGYVGLTEEFQLDSDRVVSRTLYTDQTVQLEAAIIFRVEGSEVAPPSTVSPVLDGPRGRVTPDAPLSVENGEATWTVQDLGVGSWTLSIEADGFESASIPFDVAGDGASQRVRLELVPESVPETEPAGGCAVGAGGRAPSPMPLLAVGFGLVILRTRRQRDA